MHFEQMQAAYLASCSQAIEEALERYFMEDSQVQAAARYAVLNGGKRVRGTLVLAVCHTLGHAQSKAAMAYAAAIEMIHAFSLVHDDLPCMDDDDMRRGKPATHIAFGEATALLAGDLLLAKAFEVAAEAGEASALPAVALLAKATSGMIFGQELDLRYEEQPASQAELERTHRHKTGALISASAALGVLAAGKKPQDETAVAGYAENLGRVFQIIDDILDVTAEESQLGKPIGSDAVMGKTTFVTLLGVEEARKEAKRLATEADALLATAYGDNAGFLRWYGEALLQRVF